MTNYQRITGKVFGETATATGNNPEIAQFGSALAGTFVGTTDVATIQNLPAWSNGFIGSVTPSTQFPPLPEVTGALKVLSHQGVYLLQKGIAEYDANTTYYINDLCKGVNINNEICIYKSKLDNNLNNALTNTTYWMEIPIEEFANKQTIGDWCNTEPTTISTASNNKPAVVVENYLDGKDGYIIFSDKLCIQWGYHGANTNTINLKVVMADTNYALLSHREATGSSVSYVRTETSIKPQDGWSAFYMIIGYSA